MESVTEQNWYIQEQIICYYMLLETEEYWLYYNTVLFTTLCQAI
jgi:hypothetical protein